MTQISEVMTRGVRTMTPNETVTQAAQAMNELDVGVIPVRDGTRLAGMVTDRDIVVRCVAQSKTADETPLREVMSEDVCTCQEDESVDQVLDRMREEQIRRIVVVDRNEQVVGIVSLGDIAVKENDIEAGRALEDISEPARPKQPSRTQAIGTGDEEAD